MLKYETLVLGELATNVYLLYSSNSKNCFIIDPADDSTTISDQILALKLNPKAIVLTHGHFDHAMAALDLKLIFKIPIYCSSLDLFLLKRLSQTATHWLGRQINIPNIKKIDKDLNKTKILKLGNIDIHLLKTPGHTPGGLCFYIPSQNLLFSGDTLFRQGIGRTDLSYASRSDMNKSLKKLSMLPSKTIVLSGHGPPTTIKNEFT
ncbi:MBL fold metallo-hydrolase [Patescibacteria group bacterium]|nr:MBL fold metallo-hydrolase [Patescibacteria group bacterium]MCG2702308.1 MBL fold metallo-hydrolase [Candidatus Parcubacteria bacterium]MBU4264587.1 MBL fold metallo-hydrolase [Patescibacteria group bacterium]MBU4390255.1 MBL fold metallo-hydrolase [Patescibacteria group bacterium]MBU4397325.1 MBL fold metallo-hydrolase [Patescibacteria group bacterium]